MERDFMGLNSKDSVFVKEEPVQGGCEDTRFGRSLGVPWPLSNKVSALPQFMPLKSEKDEKPSKIMSDLLTSHGAMFEATHKLQSADIQNGYSLVNPIHDVKMNPLSSTSPFLKNHFMGSCLNFGGTMMKQQFLGGTSLARPHSTLPSVATLAGTTDQWNNSMASNGPAQLTIFYGGTVNVFDDISPEKAQAIMFLAGSGWVPSNQAQPKLHMQAPAAKLPTSDRALVNQSMNMNMSIALCSGLPSPMSVSSHPIDQSASNDTDVKVSKTVGIPNNLVNKVEPTQVLPSIGSVAATAMIASAVPQARKASLARFLEKRKERVMSASPYSVSKNMADCATPDSVGFGFSSTSGMGDN